MDNQLFEFRKTYEIGPGQTDCFALLRPSALIGFMQDAATDHAELFGVSRENLIKENGVLWLLARQKYFLNRAIRSKETVTVTTWHRKTLGCIWYRDFEFEIDGIAVGGANSVWITADCQTKKMVDISEVEKEIQSLHPYKNDGPEVKKLKLPKDLVFRTSHAVSYSDLDINAHLNNVKVSDIICNAIKLEKEMKGRYIKEFQIGYLKESKPSEELRLYSLSADEGIYVSGECGGERRFESFLSLVGI
ncbi:MAG: thioesterase [Clostridiales bacterium]|nr:thioesterase [Clostridiales bacterium]